MKKIQNQANQVWAKNRIEAVEEVGQIQKQFIEELNTRYDPIYR